MLSTGSSGPFHRISGSRELERHSKIASSTYPTEDEDDERSDFDSTGELEDLLENAESVEERRELRQPETARTTFVRGVALLCACSLSIGSHYAGNILGPLKSQLHQQLGTSHTEFGLLLSAYSLNSTWTPFISGILASKLGTNSMSILTTGVILIGQIFVLLGDMYGSLRLMALGLFIFGLGVSPVSVIQETIIVRFFKSHGLGLTMAMGLFAGRAASFLAARTAYPLSEHFGPRAPFYVSTALAAFSVVVNLIYISLSRRLVDLTGAELEAVDISSDAQRRLSADAEGLALEEVAKKHQVHIHQIIRLGDVFWAYIALNVVCGFIWSPFTQLSANIIQMRYDMSEEASTDTASYLLSGPILLYPVCGYILDKRKHSPIITQLLFFSSFLTLLAYIWLALPPSFTHGPIPSIVPFAFALGFAPLLIVVMVPRIVPSKYVSTALGAHKSMEQTGSIIMQSLSGMLLDIKSGKREINSLQYLLTTFVLLNVLQGGSIWLLAHLQRKTSPTKKEMSPRDSFAMESMSNRESHGLSETDAESVTPLLDNSSGSTLSRIRTLQEIQEIGGDGAEVRRGKVIACICVAFVILAWVLVMVLAVEDLEQRDEEPYI